MTFDEWWPIARIEHCYGLARDIEVGRETWNASRLEALKEAAREGCLNCYEGDTPIPYFGDNYHCTDGAKTPSEGSICNMSFIWNIIQRDYPGQTAPGSHPAAPRIDDQAQGGPTGQGEEDR
jgi:hypothetical protein